MKRENISTEEMELGEYRQSKIDFEEKLKRWRMEYRRNKLKTKVRHIIIPRRLKKIRNTEMNE
jgi:hypothetical protein